MMIYYDSGTTNTRIYLLRDLEVVDQSFIPVGTKDSAITGDRMVLLKALKEGYDGLLIRNNLKDEDVKDVYLSGMITNPFGIIEVPHLETPIDKRRLLEGIYEHEESLHFHRTLKLIPGAKTKAPEEGITLDNVSTMGNTRGEEIEVFGLLHLGLLKENQTQVMISPGSHTHMMLVRHGVIEDISSHFTGELHHALIKETILGGEIAKHLGKYEKKQVEQGLALLEKEGISRALYVVHSTKVFGVASDEVRQMLLTGIITGSAVLHLKEKIKASWKSVDEILLIGEGAYIDTYEILLKKVLPEVRVRRVFTKTHTNFALEGLKKLLTQIERGSTL